MPAPIKSKKRRRILPQKEVLDIEYVSAPSSRRSLEEDLLFNAPSEHDRDILSQLWGQSTDSGYRKPQVSIGKPQIKKEGTDQVSRSTFRDQWKKMASEKNAWSIDLSQMSLLPPNLQQHHLKRRKDHVNSSNDAYSNNNSDDDDNNDNDMIKKEVDEKDILNIAMTDTTEGINSSTKEDTEDNEVVATNENDVHSNTVAGVNEDEDTLNSTTINNNQNEAPNIIPTDSPLESISTDTNGSNKLDSTVTDTNESSILDNTTTIDTLDSTHTDTNESAILSNTPTDTDQVDAVDSIAIDTDEYNTTSTSDSISTKTNEEDNIATCQNENNIANDTVNSRAIEKDAVNRDKHATEVTDPILVEDTTKDHATAEIKKVSTQQQNVVSQDMIIPQDSLDLLQVKPKKKTSQIRIYIKQKDFAIIGQPEQPSQQQQNEPTIPAHSEANIPAQRHDETQLIKQWPILDKAKDWQARKKQHADEWYTDQQMTKLGMVKRTRKKERLLRKIQQPYIVRKKIKVTHWQVS